MCRLLLPTHSSPTTRSKQFETKSSSSTMNFPRNGHANDFSISRTTMVFWVILGCVGMYLFSYIQMDQYLNEDQHFTRVDDRPTQEVLVEKSTSDDQICPAAAKLFDPKDLKGMIEKAKDFHQRGGSLVSIENYLNGAIQQTLDRLNIKFEFKDPQNNNKGGGGSPGPALLLQNPPGSKRRIWPTTPW